MIWLDQLVCGAHAVSPTVEALTWGAVSPALHPMGIGLKTMQVTRLSEERPSTRRAVEPPGHLLFFTWRN